MRDDEFTSGNSAEYVTVCFRVMMLLVCVTIFSPVFSESFPEYAMVNLTAGQVGILDDLDGAQRYGAEYRFKSFAGPAGFRLIPAVGTAFAKKWCRFYLRRSSP